MEKTEQQSSIPEVENLVYFKLEEREKWEKYVKDDNYVVIEDEDEGTAAVTKKYTDEQWDELDKYMDTHPIFNNNVTADDLETNEYLQALQALQYSEQADETFERLYKQGNKIMKEHLIGKKERPVFFIKKAMEAYIEALNQDSPCLEFRKKVLSNRSLINLWLKNYGKVVEDCLKATAIDPSFMTPYVRASEALLLLKKYSRCIKFIDKGLLNDPKHKILKGLKKDAEKGLKKEMDIQRAKQKKLKKVDSLVNKTCVEKGVILGALSSFPLPSVYSREMKVFNNTLVSPILFIYPQFGQFDYAGESSEDMTIWDVFEQIFTAGLPWDMKKEYTNHKKLKYYVMKNGTKPNVKLPADWDKKEGIIEIKSTDTILEAMKKPGHILPGVLEVTVVSTESGFFETFMNNF